MPDFDALDFDALLARGMFSYRAQVLQLGPENERAAGESDAALLKLAGAHALNPRFFDEHPPFFWRAEISSERMDSYSTWMAPSTLRNYAAEATEGRAFLLGHNWRDVPWGYTLQGRFVAGQKSGVARTEATLYTAAGMGGAGGMNSTDVISRLEGGFLRDVSVGFSGGRWICSIDGADMMTATWDECSHWPGMEYTVAKDAAAAASRAKKDPEAKKVLCTVSIEDAHLNEVSGVYDGATPGAAVLRAVRAVAEGRLTVPQTRVLEHQYRVRLLGDRQLYPSVELVSGGTVETNSLNAPTPDPTPVADPPNVTAEAQNVPSTAELEALRARAQQADTILRLAQEDGLEGSDPVATVRTLLAERRDNARTLADGKRFREVTIKRACEEGVRAVGDKFDRERFTTRVFPHMDVADIEAMADAWAASGDTQLVPGRATREGGETQETTPAVRRPRRLSAV